MGLYTNSKRMTRTFCTGIAVLTLVMLLLRLTLLSDMAMAGAGGVTEAASSIPGGELSAVDEAHDFAYKLNPKLYFAKPDSKAEVLILNPETNKYLLSINIMLPDTKESLYYTGNLAPGTSIDKAALSAAGQALLDGVYECVAEIAAIDPLTLAKVAAQQRPVTVYIGEKPPQ